MITVSFAKGKSSAPHDRFSGLRRRLPILVFVYCVLQPLLDVAGYWQQYYSVNNVVTMGLRMLLLVGTGLLGFLLSERKRYYVALAVLLLILTGLHILACVQTPDGYGAPMEDLVNLVRIFFLPISTLCFITFLRVNPKTLRAMRLGLAADLVLIALVQLLSTVTGTDPHTYSFSGVGVLGWFLWTNSQSAVLSMLVPLAIGYASERWSDRPLALFIMALCANTTLFFFGTRLSFACMAGGGLALCICLVLSDRRRWKAALAILFATVLLVACYPVSPVNARQEFNETVEEKNQIIRNRLGFSQSEVNADSLKHNLEVRAAVDRYYCTYHKGIVQRFGLDRVAEKYDFTIDQTILGDTRMAKRYYCELMLEDSGPLAVLFGMDLSDLRVYVPDRTMNPETKQMDGGWSNYDVEQDFHGIRFLTGYVGLALMLVFLVWIGLRALICFVRSLRSGLSLSLASFGVSYGFALIHVFFTASVLRRTNASVYFAMVLAVLWFLSCRDAEPSLSDKTVLKEVI